MYVGSSVWMLRPTVSAADRERERERERSEVDMQCQERNGELPTYLPNYFNFSPVAGFTVSVGGDQEGRGTETRFAAHGPRLWGRTKRGLISHSQLSRIQREIGKQGR